MRHTPGPWTTRPNDDETIRGESTAIDADSWTQLATVYFEGGVQDPEGEANARLIAAAPDLLAALKALLERMAESFSIQREGITGGAYSVRNDDGTQWVEEFERVEAAIAKAEGIK